MQEERKPRTPMQLRIHQSKLEKEAAAAKEQRATELSPRCAAVVTRMVSGILARMQQAQDDPLDLRPHQSRLEREQACIRQPRMNRTAPSHVCCLVRAMRWTSHWTMPLQAMNASGARQAAQTAMSEVKHAAMWAETGGLGCGPVRQSRLQREQAAWKAAANR
jgi:hypothetical protein